MKALVNMKAKNPGFTQEYLKECLNYNPETGDLIWKERPLSHFKNESIYKSWNNKYKFKKAGTYCNSGWNQYIDIRIDSKSYRGHRLIWFYVHGVWPDVIDHQNGVQTDNRVCNLRNTTLAGNCMNKRISKANKTGVMGVRWITEYSKWQSKIKTNNIPVLLYYGDDFFEACCARKSAEIQYGFHENHGMR